jgi:serine/threonine protein phosphatase PrpC
MTLALRYAVRSDVGLLREGNEDSAYAGPWLLAIADGMGGHAAGDVASGVAITVLSQLDHQPASQDLIEPLAAAVAAANVTLHEMSAADPSVEGMGTTLTAMLWQDARVALCHIGDSRAYLLRDGEFVQITRDHTLVQSLVDDGRLTPQAAASHPQRSLLLRALDGRSEVEPDLSIREAKLGDRYLLCSDGLSSVVAEQTLHKTLQAIPDPDDAVIQLIELAIRGGGPDNITCIVADVVPATGGPVPPSRASVIAGAASSADNRPPMRTDTPASRAHQLTQFGTVPPPTGTHHAPPAEPKDTRDFRVDGRHAPAGGDGDDADEVRYARRRWPVVTSVLVVLLLLIGGGGYAGWRYIQGQYYVGADHNEVVIFRGINETVAGLSLSSVHIRTDIPLSHVVDSDRQQVVDASIPSSGLAKAKQVVLGIQHDYTCQQYSIALTKWQDNKPKPVRTKKKLPNGKTRIVTKTAPYGPRPVRPAFCTAAQGGSG